MAWMRDDAGGLRAGWRVAAFWGLVALALVAWNVLARLMATLLGVTTEELLPSGSHRRMLTGSAVFAVAAMAASRLVIRRFEKASVRGFLGFPFEVRSARTFLRYFLLGGAVMGTIFVLLAATRAVTVEIHAPDLAVFAPLAAVYVLDFLIAALGEEMFDRGYVFRVLAARHPRFAILFTATVFSLGHFFEVWRTPLSMANVLLAGCLLGALYLRTGSLWAVWGLHAGLNVFEVVMFQFPVAGYEALADHTFSYQVNAGEWALGGPAGIQGGVVYSGVVVVFLVSLLLRGPSHRAA